MTLEPDALLAIILGMVALVVSIAAFVRANPNATPAALDAEVVRLLTDKQADREAMDRLERAYQSSDAAHRKALDTTVAVLRFVAPLTPLKSDDEALKLLEDAQTPGTPPVPSPN